MWQTSRPKADAQALIVILPLVMVTSALTPTSIVTGPSLMAGMIVTPQALTAGVVTGPILIPAVAETKKEKMSWPSVIEAVPRK